jgi:hypothetical protein
MWNRLKWFIVCVLGYVLLTNVFVVWKKPNLYSFLTVPGIGILSAISGTFVFRLADSLGDYFFYTVAAFLTALFLFIPMIIYGFQPHRKWLILQVIILILNAALLFYMPLRPKFHLAF